MSERLYNLLPAVYRVSDAYEGDPLRGLMAILESEYARLETDVSQLYNNWFIETCEEWVVPYIADLFGLKGVSSSEHASMRAFVGNTIAYRRRKGTPQVLEELARDLLNRPVRIQEFFLLLANTQNLNHLRLERLGTCVLREPDTARRVAGAFDSSMHVVDVRLPRYNLPNIGLSVFRLGNCSVVRGTAFKVKAGCYTFDPFGRDLPLFNRERTQFNAFEPVLESDVPAPLSRWPLEEELRQFAAGLEDKDGVYFGNQPVLSIFLNGSEQPVERQNICIADLQTWRRPTGTQVAIDPVLGRLSIPSGAADTVSVSYSYGSPGDIGGGPYFRKPTDETDDDWKEYNVPTEFPTLTAAITACNNEAMPQARIVVDSDETFAENLAIEGQEFQLIAANGRRPCLIGNINVRASKTTLRGFWIKGQIAVEKSAQSLVVSDCSVFPGATPSLSAPDVQNTLTIEIDHSIVGRCEVSADAEELTISDSLINAISGPAAAEGATLSISRSTVFGTIKTRELLLLSESIVTGNIASTRTQRGCARFSWILPRSLTPRKYRCQPDLETDRLAALANSDDRSLFEERATIATRPRFQSSTPGNPAYGQLGLGCPAAVKYGAEDEGEMGAWHLLYEQERMQNLRTAIGEYVRFGLEYGVIERS